MGVLVKNPPHYTPAPQRPVALELLWKIFSVVRYRFFLYAGLLPYLLGAAWAYVMESAFNPGVSN